ncbi:OmpA family protein [Vibrio nomapromontoriensis]|uniref:OmpA family protein n=1 Tax=Vibrio nomapromontoriensis TaxID=2910246 RepID=UPI003D122B02
MDIFSHVKVATVSAAILLLAACSSYPEEGTGGVAEQYAGSDFSPVMPDEPLGPEHGLRFDWKLAKLQLDSLIREGASWCFPAAVLQAQEKQNRIARELEGGLWIDAANDIVIQRKKLNDLELRLDYVRSQAACAPPMQGDDFNNLMQVVQQIYDLLNVDNQFAVDSTEINPKYMGHLAEAANILKRHTSIRLSVTGHADITGSSEHNDKLALGRAQQVKRYLSIFGLNPQRIDTYSLGDELPLYEGNSDGVRLTNRRVSIEVLADDASSTAMEAL